MKSIIWIGICFICFVLGIISLAKIEGSQMENYDLYNCVWNNAKDNKFTDNPILIQKIQDECICFRDHNYTNLFKINCSTPNKTTK